MKLIRSSQTNSKKSLLSQEKSLALHKKNSISSRRNSRRALGKNINKSANILKSRNNHAKNRNLSHISENPSKKSLLTRITEKAKLKKDDNKKLKKRLVTEQSKKKNKSILEKINKLGTSKSQKSTKQDNKYGIKILTDDAMTTHEKQKVPKSEKSRSRKEGGLDKERKSSRKKGRSKGGKGEKKKKATQDHFKILVSKKRKISITHGKSGNKKREKTGELEEDKDTVNGDPLVNDSKISSSFKVSIDSKNNNILANLNSKETAEKTENPKDLEDEKREKQRQNELELTDRPLKSGFLFRGMDSIPLNCSEKDSITYKIGRDLVINLGYF